MTKPPAVIDLFAGAGGLGVGAVKAGGELRLSVDNDHFSCQTLRLNANGSQVLEGDVTMLSGRDLRSRADVANSDDLIVVGGAPCQPFSKAAYWVDPGKEAAYRRARARGEESEKPAALTEARPDSRRTLVHEFLRLTIEADASGFLFENVPSILHPRNKHIFEALRRDAEEAGFHTTTVVATATDYGVAQARQRVFLLGSRDSSPLAPDKTHGGKIPIVTAGDAISHLDVPELAEDGETVTGRWADHLAEVPPGWNYKHHTAWAGHPSPTFETETRYWNFLLKLAPDRPSWTLPASPGPWTGPFHWTGRRLRTLEMAALQSFPEDYVFAGPRRERVRQIGNAVPSAMAAAAFGSVLRAHRDSVVAA
ncbi:MAG: DNA cytosine methyltransferase [Actinobacteria bacterium]|nr:DNA cytosine methyltransferase [Actinomycetota bacterium]